MQIVSFIFKIFQALKYRLVNILTQNFTYILMKIKRVEFDSSLISLGVPIIFAQGKLKIGRNVIIVNTIAANPIGRSRQCMFIVRKNAILKIGNNVGMSGTSIVCQKEITISDNVKIGGNVCIYDTDFHSLNALERNNEQEDVGKINTKSVFIDKNVFIGAHVTILKGVEIGENSIIGACSVVAKNIPKNEIWAGNPAKFIRKINDH